MGLSMHGGLTFLYDFDEDGDSGFDEEIAQRELPWYLPINSHRNFYVCLPCYYNYLDQSAFRLKIIKNDEKIIKQHFGV